MTRFSLAFMLGVWVTVAAYALGRWTRFPWIKPHRADCPLGDEFCGIVSLHKHNPFKLGYGKSIDLPCWVNHAVVTGWNWIACRIVGHDYLDLGPEFFDSVCCSSCSKEKP